MATISVLPTIHEEGFPKSKASTSRKAKPLLLLTESFELVDGILHLQLEDGEVMAIGRGGVAKTTKKRRGTIMQLTDGMQLLFIGLMSLESVWQWYGDREQDIVNSPKQSLPKAFSWLKN